MEQNKTGKAFRTIAIGDIHGYYRHLERLLEYVNYNAKNDRLIFLGDYIDRGENPKKTLDLLIELFKVNSNNVFMLGNHEDMMLSCINEDGRYSRVFWYSNGAEETLKSFGKYSFENLNGICFEYLNFLSCLKPIFIDEKLKLIFVHGGINPAKSICEQDFTDEFLGPLWIRSDFYNYKGDFKGYTVIFGHTPTFNMRKNLYTVMWEGNKIGIDTGLCYGYSLTALEILGDKTMTAYYVDKDFNTTFEDRH